MPQPSLVPSFTTKGAVPGTPQHGTRAHTAGLLALGTPHPGSRELAHVAWPSGDSKKLVDGDAGGDHAQLCDVRTVPANMPTSVRPTQQPDISSEGSTITAEALAFLHNCICA